MKAGTVMAILGVGGLAVGGYALMKGINIQEELGKGIGGFPQFIPFEIPSLKVIQVPQISQLTERFGFPTGLGFEGLGLNIGEMIGNAVKPFEDALTKVNEEIESLKKGVSELPEKTKEWTKEMVTAPPKGIFEGIKEIISGYPIPTGAIAGATIGATIGSIVPGAGTLAGGVVGGTTGLISSAIPHKLIPDLERWWLDFQNRLKGIGEFRGLGTQAIGKVSETITTSEPISIISGVVSSVSEPTFKTVTVGGKGFKMPGWWKPTGTEIMTAVGGMTLIPGY